MLRVTKGADGLTMVSIAFLGRVYNNKRFVLRHGQHGVLQLSDDITYFLREVEMVSVGVCSYQSSLRTDILP
jgi:hypothetical protein